MASRPIYDLRVLHRSVFDVLQLRKVSFEMATPHDISSTGCSSMCQLMTR